MNHKSSRMVLPALLLTVAIVVALNAWLAFRSVSALLDRQFWVEHTWEVILQVERIISSAKDAETGTRGFLITDREEYLEPYHSAQKELPEEIERFRTLTSDNPTQQARLDEMRKIVARKMAWLQSRIDARRYENKAKSYQPLAGNNGKAEMDRLRHIADDMEVEERRLLALRTVGARNAGGRTRLTIALASTLDFLLILLMFRYYARERRMRLAAELAGQRVAIARAEAEKRANEVRVLNATLEERVKSRTAELEITNRELEAFSYSVSHDLRAPLRTIDGFSVALAEDYASAVDKVGQDYIHRIRFGVRRMGLVIDALLQLSRVTRAEFITETVNLTQLAVSLVAILCDENPDRDITFNIEPGMEAKGDPRLLQVALENLFGNAVKFSSKMPKSIIDFGWDKEKKAWFVRDNGAGFDMSYAAKLFNAFNRLHGDKDFQGSGIGLATVARVVQRHQGKVWADSTVNRGATFWFTLG